MQKILKLKEDFPAGRVRPEGKLIWILDPPAGQNINHDWSEQYYTFVHAVLQLHSKFLFKLLKFIFIPLHRFECNSNFYFFNKHRCMVAVWKAFRKQSFWKVQNCTLLSIGCFYSTIICENWKANRPNLLSISLHNFSMAEVVPNRRLNYSFNG